MARTYDDVRVFPGGTYAMASFEYYTERSLRSSDVVSRRTF